MAMMYSSKQNFTHPKGQRMHKQLSLTVLRSCCGVMEKNAEVAGSMPGFTSLSDETLSHGPVSI